MSTESRTKSLPYKSKLSTPVFKVERKNMVGPRKTYPVIPIGKDVQDLAVRFSWIPVRKLCMVMHFPG